MTKKLFSLVAVGLLSVALYGQADKDNKRPNTQSKTNGDEHTMTGCLTEQQGNYMLATAAGEQVGVKGSGDFAKHKNHTVKLTGKASEEGGKHTMMVTSIEHVSPSCATSK